MTYLARFLVWRKNPPDDWWWHRRRRHITIGRPVFTDLKGNIMPISFPSNQLAYFPLLVNGAAPPAADQFTATTTDTPPIASYAIGVMPSGPDAGDPAVVVTALTLAGGAGTFQVKDQNANDTGASESFTITAPAIPPGVITVDDPNVIFAPNPNPPTA